MIEQSKSPKSCAYARTILVLFRIGKAPLRQALSS